MKEKFVTTPIYYVNGTPHIGHAYTTIVADVYARYFKQKGDEVYLLTGTDEHGAKIAQSALEKDWSPLQLVDQNAKEFKQTWQNLNVNFNQFIRTTDDRHAKVVEEVLTKIKDNGFIYPGKYSGLYCVGCEEYKKENDLVDGLCPIHKIKPELLEENVWFFKLSAFQNDIEQLISLDKLKIFPETRKNELLSFIKSGLEDIALSRSQVEWGINLPWDETQTVYVWVEALLNYYSAPIIDHKPDLFPPDVQFVGKDILRFHGVIWPALLMALGEKRLPQQLAVHGFFTIDNQKMSKSLGNVIAPKELVDLFGVDATRYLLLSQFPFGNDGDFSIDKLKAHYTADLVNGLGNLVQRVLTVANKLEIKIELGKVSTGLEIIDFNFYEALNLIKNNISQANKYVDETKPWRLVKGSDEARVVIGHLVAQIHQISYDLQPFMPETSAKIVDQLTLGQPVALFPRLGQ